MKTNFIMPKLIETFKKIVLEYFEKLKKVNLNVDTTPQLYGLTAPKCIGLNANIIFIGLNTIIHIFRITTVKYKNTNITYHYCKQGFFYYLEYIQQITHNNFQNNLNINDAVIFVYSKTLIPTAEVTENVVMDVILENNTILLNNLATITNHLLLWNSELSLTTRSEIIQLYLSKFLTLFTESLHHEKYINTLLELTHRDQIEEFYKSSKRLCK